MRIGCVQARVRVGSEPRTVLLRTALLDRIPVARTVAAMSTKTLDAYAAELGQDLQPVFVTDLLDGASPEEIDSWIRDQGPGSRHFFMPASTYLSWRDVPVLLVPRDGSGWVGRTDRSLMGRALHARALAVRAHAGRPVPGDKSPQPPCVAPDEDAVALALNTLAAQMGRWSSGELDATSAAALVKRTHRQLVTACWCALGVCCGVHETHANPHLRCILR